MAGWTRAAQWLFGYSSAEVVSQPASLLFPPFPSATAAFVKQCRARGGWFGRAAVRHRAGHRREVSLRLSLLTGQGGTVSWLVSATDVAALSSRPNGPVRESLLTRGPIGIVVRDFDLRCTYVNDVMERQDGIPCHMRLGHRHAQSVHGQEDEALEAVMRQVLHSGIPAVHEYRALPVAARGREHVFSVWCCCVEDADGCTTGVCCMSVDITSSQRARERLAILSEAGTRIGSTLDVMQTGQELAELAVPLLADCAIVDLADPVMLEEDLPRLSDPARACAPAFRRAGLASVRQGAPEAVWSRGELISVSPVSPLIGVLVTGQSYLERVVDTAPGTWLRKDALRAQKVHDHGIHSLMIVPIRARCAVLGLALFLRTKDPVPFEEDDLLLAEELVSRAALSLDNARRYTHERATALALQRNLLPQQLPGGPAVEVASRYLPADMDDGVGGDWFDVIPLSGARVAMVVGDVVGHGINAAATMGRLRTAVHTLAGMELPPDELLAHLDDMVQRLTEEDTGPDGPGVAVMGATCLYAIYDPVSQQCTMARAGHPPPIIVAPNGDIVFPEIPAGVPLGLGLEPFEAVEVELPEGSLIALYTDGLVESRDHDIDVGMNLLSRALVQPDCSLEDLCSAVIDIIPTPTPSDDVTLLLARTRSLDACHTRSWNLPTDPAVVSNARALTADQLTEWGLERLISTTQLIVSELVTNAIRHGTGPIRLRLIRHQQLTCEVCDGGNCVPRLRHARTTDEHGRGLFLVARLSQRWGTRHATDHKIVWAEQDLSSMP
ncbi:Phosphoserine phosphatase RsbU [Streptomyces sp. MBT84]|nr:Phosphoserine phosphatase RsbU [Streptomyces sp. MBT84]